MCFGVLFALMDQTSCALLFCLFAACLFAGVAAGVVAGDVGADVPAVRESVVECWSGGVCVVACGAYGICTSYRAAPYE